MKHSKPFNRILVFFLTAVIVVLLAGLYMVFWNSFYVEQVTKVTWAAGDWLIFCAYLIFLLIFAKVYSSKSLSTKRLSDIIYSQTLAALFTNVFSYMFLCLLGSAFLNVLPMLLLTVCDGACIIVWSIFAKNVYDAIYPARHLIFVYGSRDPSDYIRKISQRSEKYIIDEVVHISEGLDSIRAKVHSYDAVVICELPSLARNRLLKYCFDHSIRTYVVPKLSDIILRGAEDSNIFDSPLLVCKNQDMPFEKAFAKRALDLCVIIPVAIVCAPIMLIIALMIKLYDGGSVLYKQERLTQGGKVFMIYKFRSMRMNSEQGKAQLAKKNDERVTPIGKVLRAIHFDELPQIINILKGDMSIVGPRPERPEIAEKYREIIPEFNFRLKVKAGLTGYAQVFGKYNTTPYDKLKLDLYYIEHQSLLLDIELILKTIKILFVKENTEGVESWQTTAADRRMQNVHQAAAVEESHHADKPEEGSPLPITINTKGR